LGKIAAAPACAGSNPDSDLPDIVKRCRASNQLDVNG
jgi:hypothetical protein